MGREIKRVVAGFNWPLSKTWTGFLNPYSVPDCPDCEGGYSADAKRFSDEWYGYVPFDPASTGSKPFDVLHPAIAALADRNAKSMSGEYMHSFRMECLRLAELFNSRWSHHLSQDDVQALVDGNRLWDFMRIFVPGKGWQDRPDAVVPTAAEVNEWSLYGFGHDSCNQWVCVKARCEREGVSETCGTCNGSGSDPRFSELKALYEGWKPTDPPAGEWWQVWETVSEGSPVTPAFATDAELIDYLVAEGDAWTQGRGDGGWTLENAVAFVSAGWAMSGIMERN